MTDVRSILIAALKAQLITATGYSVYDSVPIHLAGTLVYPHIQISDIFVKEEGPKTNFEYNASVLIEINHRRLTTLATLYADMGKVKGILTVPAPFPIAPYTMIDCRLENDTTTKATVNRELIDIGIIRLIFRIK